MAEQNQPGKPTDAALNDVPLTTSHPSRSLPSRARGYGIAAGYERPYQRVKPGGATAEPDEYGPIPHSGYYGTGDSTRPFKRGQASYSEELLWYPAQYGVETSGYEPTE